MLSALEKIITNPDFSKDINAVDSLGNNVLMQISGLIMAVSCEAYQFKSIPNFKPYFEAIKHFRENGAQFIANHNQVNPFHISAYCNHVDFAELLYHLEPELFKKQIVLEPHISNIDILHYFALKTNIDLVPCYYLALLKKYRLDKIVEMMEVLKEKRKLISYI